MMLHPGVSVVPVTSGPKSHFFGYYDKCPWDETGRYLLGMETDLTTEAPGAGDTAVVGLIDTANDCSWQPLAKTTAWNWQMGSRLHWLPTAPTRRIVCNARQGKQFVAVLRDVFTGDETCLSRPVYDVTRDGKVAYTLNFSRLAAYRPGYGYAGVPDASAEELRPDDDGIWRMDLETGQERLLVSYAAMASFEPVPSMAGVAHWFNHIMINPSGTRLFFYHRWRKMEGQIKSWHTRLVTIDPDGSRPFVIPGLNRVSHYDWRDDRHILLTAYLPGATCYSHVLVADQTGERRVLGADLLRENGHCSYSPNREWILTDTYPDADSRSTLLLFRPRDETRIEVGRFWSPPAFTGEARCDLHPRWNRDGTRVCFDSPCQGHRQMLVADLSDLIRNS